ncbi:MAG: hypothetical protein ACREQW_25435 [Candidatus Binatia bacterium]
MPMPTPFHEHGAVDYEALDASVDFYLAGRLMVYSLEGPAAMELITAISAA